MATWFEIEEDAICAAHDRGEITDAEMKLQMAAVRRDYLEAAHDASYDAYQAEMGRW